MSGIIETLKSGKDAVLDRLHSDTVPVAVPDTTGQQLLPPPTAEDIERAEAIRQVEIARGFDNESEIAEAVAHVNDVTDTTLPDNAVSFEESLTENHIAPTENHIAPTEHH